MDIVQPTRQTKWGIAAVMNFWLGGMSTAAYILFFAAHALFCRQYNVTADFLFLTFFLMATGFLLVALHAGRPGRAGFAGSRFRSSWMARETVAGFIFFLAAVLNLFFPHTFLSWLSLLSAFLFLLSQSMMPYKSIGVGGWRVLAVPVLFTILSFSSGVGLILLSVRSPLAASFDLLRIAGIFLIALNGVMWICYVYRSNVSPSESVSAFRKRQSLILVFGGGMLLPILLLLFVIYSGSTGKEEAHSVWRMCEALAGVALIGGAFLQKYYLIVHAGWWRPLRLGVVA